MSMPIINVGLVGARGHTGAELMRLIGGHPRFSLGFVSSREFAGQRVADHHDGVVGELHYQSSTPDTVATAGMDAYILAMPNDKAGEYVAALDAAGTDPVIVDLSADHRFDAHWYYGLPELTRKSYEGQRRISNPGCYATAMQLVLAPMLDVLDGPAQCFGVSGYSGAGTTPSDRNDPVMLRDNLMPYALAGHIHEREVSHQLGHPVEFMPHVAPHFRGITMTANMPLQRPFSRDEVIARYRERYADEPLVRIVDEAPWVSAIAGRHHVDIGGFTLSADGRRLVAVATEDNLLKGAATQAMQNLNRAFALPELAGIPV
ncbi:N-acetyl-gamma-glutamyl-phosphate reductase [Lysobacter sp. H21R4]|uniref:N-acetyl-gamma-glutamyl-phosphate reductase n=1 Tax=Lysobacter sp. H21R4 TaxID=2781021 RepID=UPI0018891A88|nr:N-acetyl-gamma-glutamyl-phosphate reductase [Lysobacter sp. H21R4]QOY63638.1 N-acetyl-gamma-glutamyl-phosphate reductase [Lysobacter sp. H21R4]